MVDCHKYQRKYFELIVGESYKPFHTVLLSLDRYIIAKNGIRFKGKLGEALLSNPFEVNAEIHFGALGRTYTWQKRSF